MPPRLGEILASQGLLTEEELEEALESQVVHGGRLGTNLVELGLVTESQLARALGRQRSAQYASGEMAPDPKALALVDAKLADRKDVLPMRMDATRLYVACLDPSDLATFDALAFRSGKVVVPVVIPEFRMNQLLRKHYRAWRPVRPIDMNVTRPSRVRGAKAEQASPPPPELMGEDEFQALYANLVGAPGASADDLPVLEAEAIAERAEPPAPLSFAQAQAELAKSDDREDVARTVLRYASGKWKRAMLLSVQPPLLSGWRGAGEGMSPEVVRSVVVALGGQGAFDLVCQTRSHFVGPIRRDPGSAAFYRMLGGDFPRTAVLLPLLLRGRVAHVLYLDDGPGAFTAPDVGELLILAQAVARSYEAMLRRRLT